MRHYNNSAIREAKATKNALEQAFPAETRELCVLKAPIKKKSLAYYRQFWVLMFKNDKFSLEQFREKY